MAEKDVVTLVVSKEHHRAIQLAKLDTVSREALVEGVMALRARDLFTLVKILISQVGKEKAKELIEEAQYSAFYERGIALAEKTGHPTDMDGYIETNNIGLLGHIPSAPLPEVVERTKNRFVTRVRQCYQAESLLKFGAEDPETFEVVKYMCPHDTARVNGFNPKMKFKRTKFLPDGDDCCEHVAEVE